MGGVLLCGCVIIEFLTFTEVETPNWWNSSKISCFIQPLGPEIWALWPRFCDVGSALIRSHPPFLFEIFPSLLAELADLPLIRLDFSCNKITEIPAAYRKLRQLQHIILDNNPMQSPPAQASAFISSSYLCTISICWLYIGCIRAAQMLSNGFLYACWVKDRHYPYVLL